MRKLVVLLAALAVMTSSIVGPTRDSASAGSVPVMAPVSAEYLAAQAGNVLPVVAERPLGFVPSPVDLSHLTSFQPTGQDVLVAPAQYDLRTLGRVSPVKDQGSCACCWAFAAYGSLESVVYPTEQWDFSEQNLRNLSGFDSGGDAPMAIAYMARWAGPVRETDDPFNAAVSTSPAGLTVPRYLSSALVIPDRSDSLDNAALKSAVQGWGAVQTSMYMDDAVYYKAGPHSYYYGGGAGSSNHAVAIVGWDDSYSRLNFNTAPAGDGAFIIRNSWGTDWGDGGYFYVSYYDTVIGHNNWVFILGTGAPVDTHNYGYDDLGWVGSMGLGSSTGWEANVFTLNAGSGAEVIDRVAFYTTGSGASYTLRIYGTVSGAVFSNLLTEESGACAEAGYHSVSLAAPVTVAHGQKIAVVVKLMTPGYNLPLACEFPVGGYSSAAHAEAGQSYYSRDGSSWSDLTSWKANANLCIRAFTHDAVPSFPSAPVLSSPADGTTLGSLTPTLTWATAAGAASYTVQVSLSSTFGTTVLSQTTSATSLTTPTLAAATRHYWRVNATNAAGTSPWSSIWSFTTPPAYTLTLDTIGSGSVVKSPNQSSYVSGTVVTLSATPLAGSTFTGWSGDRTGTTNPTTVTMNANKAVTATFTPDAYTLTVTPPVNGTVTKSPDQATYSYGTVVTLTATPAFGYGFVVWTGNLSGSTNPATITMTGNRTVTATFTALPTYVLSTTASPSQGGTIGKSPSQSSYLAGTVVTLTVTPLVGYTFTGWSGDLTGSTNPATITMNANKTVAATFTAIPTYTLSTTVSPTLGGTIGKSPNLSSYLAGTVVTLTATPLAGYTFTSWSGDLTGSTNPATITMNANRTVTATFTALPTYVLSTTASPSQGGTIGKSPNQSSYLAGTVVTLTATPLAGYTFTGWSGDLTGSTNPATITMNANKTVAATFLALGPGSVHVVATLDGEPWSGEVQFSLTDGISVITGSAVPFYMEEVNPGSFTIDATGGPAGKVLRYAPSKTQHVTSGLGTTFTLEYSSEATVPGDLAITAPLPGDVAGSSVSVEGLAYDCPPGSLLTVTARVLPLGVPVTVISNMQIDVTPMTWSGTLTAAALGLTAGSDVEIVARLTGFPSGTEARVLVHWTSAGARILALLPGWNLVGVSSPLPLVAVPGFIQCFGYQNGWSILGAGDVLQPGLGYWLQVADAVDVVLPGLETSGPVSVTYEAGWQLLGNPYNVSVPVTSITHWDLVTTCFLYGPNWGIVDLLTDSLEPGRGYWIQLSAPTTLTLTRP